jgi:hypothetical protein
LPAYEAACRNTNHRLLSPLLIWMLHLWGRCAAPPPVQPPLVSRPPIWITQCYLAQATCIAIKWTAMCPKTDSKMQNTTHALMHFSVSESSQSIIGSTSPDLTGCKQVYGRKRLIRCGGCVQERMIGRSYLADSACTGSHTVNGVSVVNAGKHRQNQKEK